MNIDDFMYDLEGSLYHSCEDYEGNEIKNISSFQDVGMLTRNKGLVVKLKDGSEFQLTVVQSKRAIEDEKD